METPMTHQRELEKLQEELPDAAECIATTCMDER